MVAGAASSACSVDDRRLTVGTGSLNPGGQSGDNGFIESGCDPAGCPRDDVCRRYGTVPKGTSPDAGCCPFDWTPAAREGAACRCDDNGCSLLLGEACSAPAGCADGNCVAAAAGGSVCCAQACAETEVCAPDGSACAPAEPCTGEGRRCSGALHQSCVDGAWQTLTDCGALGCSPQLDSCLHAAGQACESDADCGEGACLPAADGNRVCCTGACTASCQRCSPAGTECVNVDDDEACGPIACPTDPCRLYDPATVVTNRCAAGQCATPEQACTVFQPQRAGLECSTTALCDDAGGCTRPKGELLAPCTSNEQCSTGACVATVAGTSVCCAQACAASEVCGPAGACVPAPVCDDDAVQCSGSNFQRCVSGQWVTQAECGALGCSLPRQGCNAGAGQPCSANGDCGAGTCQATAAGTSVCCTAACDGPCRDCNAAGTACTELPDDAACGPIDCPDDTPCR
ncbi:MAG TPA: hypothetical protein VNN80_32600, partial [Polyangiaceae bacterium]|nr:hypothetical protein [Polyangiaceae bacterium]